VAESENPFGDEFAVTNADVKTGSSYTPLFSNAGDIKLASLPTLVARKQRNVADALTSKLGVDPYTGLGQLVNLGASLASGASRVAGNVATLPLDYISGLAQASVPEDVIQAYNRDSTFRGTDADKALLDSIIPNDQEGAVPQTYRDRIIGTQGLQNTAQNVADFFDISSIVDTTRRDRLSDDIRESTAEGVAKLRAAKDAYDKGNLGDAALTGTQGLGQTIGNALATGVQDPGAVSEYVAENTPQLAAAAVNPLILTATNAGYGFDTYRKGITEYAKENDNTIPDAEDRTSMGLFAASAALAEQVGDISLLRGMHDSGKGIGAAAGAIASNTVKEGVTEGYQTYAENQAQLKDTSIEDVVESAAIGGLVGGNFQLAGSIATRASGTATSAAERIERSQATQQLFDEARTSGNVDDLARVDPTAAVVALGELSKDADQATVDINIKKADQIQKDLTAQLSSVQARMDNYTEEGRAELAETLDWLNQNNGSKADIQTVQNAIKAADDYTPAKRKADTALVEQLQSQLEGVQTASERLRVDTTPDVDALVEQASEGDKAAVDRVLTLTMTNPDAVTTQNTESLVSNPELSDEQRDALAKYDDARTANNEFKSRGMVNSDVINGGEGFRGLTQYRNAIRLALGDNDIEAAQSQVDSLATFAQSRVSKAAAITAAFEQVKGTNEQIGILPDAQGNWNQVDLPAAQVRKAGGLMIGPTSFRLRDDVQSEANVLTKNALAFQALINAKPETPVTAPAQVQPGETNEVGAAPVETAATVNNEANPTGEVTEQAPEAAPETGELTAVKQATGVTVDSSNRQQVNLVGELFNQEKGSDTDASARPLVAVKDFASQIRAGKVSLKDFLAQKGEITGPQRSALKNFFGFSRLMDKHITDGFTRLRQPDFRFQDYSQFLINEDGTVDENARTAISYGMFTWLGENAGALFNTQEGINQILNRDSDDEVSAEAWRVLGKVGTREDVIANQVGARIAQSLGLRAKDGTPASDTARLETALGIKAIAAMARAGLVNRTEVSDKTLQRLMNSPDAPSNAVHTFIAVSSEQLNDREVANEVVRKIRESTTGSQSVINKLMGVETAGVEPSYEPVKFDQQYAKRTNREIPQVLADRLDKEGAKPHRIRQDMHQVWGVLSDAARYQIAGVVNTTDIPTHAYNQASREAKNAGLMEQVDNYTNFTDKMVNDPATEGLEQPMYFGRSVWMPQRVGLNTNVINPQTSKVHRHMLAMEGWETEVDTNDVNQMNNFKLRVLESFGVKTEAKATALVLNDYDAKVNTPVIQKAVDLLSTILQGEATNPDENVILDAVKEAGENFHSLDALVSLAHMQNAQDGKFKTTLMAEVDGVTNGPMLSLLMLGAKGFDVLNQGGFYQQGQLTENGDLLTQFNDFHGKQGNLDLYESTVAGVLSRLDSSNPLLAALQDITGQLRTPEGDVTSKGRKVIKQPLTAMMFGSNTTTAVQGMADGFIESIYSKMEDAAQANDTAAMTKVLTAVNTLTRHKSLHVDANMGIQPAMETTLTRDQTLAIKQTFHELLGKPTEDSLNDNYGLFMARRDTVNQTAQLAFRLYDAAYTSLIEEAEANSPSIARRTTKNGGEQQLSSLSGTEIKAINDRLKDMQPILLTAMAKESGQLEAGMNMSKSKRELDKTTPFTSEVYFGESVPTYQEDGSVMQRKGTNVNGLRTKAIDPGVAPFITGIHSTDSSIASTVYGGMNALNVHDALGVGLHEAQDVGQRLNKATYDNMLNYSTPSEMVNTLQRVMTGLQTLMQDENLAPRIQAKLKAVTAELEQRRLGTINDHLDAIRNVASEADTEKLTMLATMQAVGQYATDGGSYIVTDADRLAATQELNKIGDGFDPAAVAAAQYLDEITKAKALDLKAAAAKVLNHNSVETLSPATTLNTMERMEQSEDVQAVRNEMLNNNIPLVSAKEVLPADRAAKVVNDIHEQTRQQNVWGEIGTPLVQSNVDLVNILATNKLTAHNLIDSLDALSVNPFNKGLLAMIKRAVPATMPITYITKDTGPDGALGTGVSKARGWYHQEAGSAGIYVKSPDFVESGITPEFLTHELVHAALANLVDQQTGKNNDAGKAIAELEALRQQASDLIAQNGALSGKYQNATSNVHELLAWGLTNQRFQKEVLGAIKVDQKTGVINGLRKFISSLSAMLFRGNNSKANETGLGLLVANASDLFATAAKLREQRNGQTHLYEDAVNHVNAMTSGEVFDALEGASPRVASAEHRTHLRDVIDTLVTTLYGPYGAFKEEASANRAITPMDVYLKSLSTGQKPFASRAITGPFQINQQEGFALESVQATVEAAMVNPNTVFIRQALQNLYTEAKKTLKPENFHNGDWATATPTERSLATEKHAFVFDAPLNPSNRNDRLSQFAALGIASEEVRNILTFSTADQTQPLKSLPWGARLIELFRRVMAKLASIHTKVTSGTQANEAIDTLVGQMVDIEAKRKQRMIDAKLSALDQVEVAVGNVGNNIRARAEAFGRLPFFKQARSPIVRVAGSTLSAVAGDRVGKILDHISVLRGNAIKAKEGVIAGIVTEMRGAHDGNRIAAELFKNAKAIEKDRKDWIENTISQVNDSFKDGGAYLTQADRDALTRVFLRTNASALSDAVGTAGLKDLMENPVMMAAHRDALETQLQNLSTDFGYLSAATKDLAYHKVIGGNVSDNLMLNTRNIASLLGTNKALKAQNMDAVTKVLDQLLPVYALSYVNSADRVKAMEVFRTESQRGDHSGIDMILKLHSGLQKRSADMLFKGQEALMQSGFVPEIHDNKIDVLLVDGHDIEAFEKAGYVQGTKLQKDPSDTATDDRVLMTRRGSGQAGLLTGSLSYTGMHRKGSSPDRASMNLLNGTQVTAAAHKKAIATAKAPLIADLFNRGLNYDPLKQKAGKLVPVLAPDGRIADYRYMMTEHNRDVLLDRDNSMDQVLGALAGQIIDKSASADQNADVVRAMHDQYRADYANRPSSYIQVGKDSTDPELAELYRLLPESTKREINKVWKNDNMLIPADQLNMVMGYRKYSLTEPFARPERDLKKKADVGDRNWAEQLFVITARGLFGEKAALRVGQAEDIMQELVKEAKDILVIKNITTLVGNMMSNISLLLIEGVSPRNIIESHAVAIKGALDYRKDNKRLIQIRQALEVGYIPEGQKALEDEMLELQDRIARNPIKPLIDAGLMPTIVEDVEADDSQYSYKSQLQRSVSKYTDRIPKLLREAGKQVYMTHDTSTYKFLSQTTQLSDLVARYAMYQHLITRTKDPLSKTDALRQAEDSFVNYDLPSHRSIQFLNDTGVFMFTKYYMRIQKTIMRLMREKPARVMASIALSHYIDGVENIMNSSWVNRLGNNPLHDGALGYVGSLGELPAFKAL
jgi:hypothetical protein